MSTQAISNQLRHWRPGKGPIALVVEEQDLLRLVDRRVVATPRDGNYIVYRLIDPCVPGLLGLAWCLAEETGRLGDSTAAASTSKGKCRRAGVLRRKR
jgi:hypothetical protein